MEYLATFHTHYGALCFNAYCKKNRLAGHMIPVPRELSASCGTCVRFSAKLPPMPSDHEDMEHCYMVMENDVYNRVED